MTTEARPGWQASGLTYRPARPDEIAACADVWRISINDYIVPLGQHEVPPDTNQVTRLFRHLQSTDPLRFVVATTPDDGTERVVAFASAIERERLWFLNMLFVRPGLQGVGVGRRLLAHVLPGTGDGRHSGDAVRATATDSAQPISNSLYATYGIAPRMPLFNLVGLPIRPDAFGALPSGVTAVEVEAKERAATLDSLDRALLGVAHPVDHAFFRSEGRRCWIFLGPDGAGVGFGYAGEAGRIGPVGATDAALLAPILGYLTTAVVPRGAFAIWIGGAADRALVPLLQAGFRMEAFPVLLCWDRPFADFSRYLPNSPGLL